MNEYYIFTRHELETYKDLVNHFYKPREVIQKIFYDLSEELRDLINLKEIIGSYEKSWFNENPRANKRKRDMDDYGDENN